MENIGEKTALFFMRGASPMARQTAFFEGRGTHPEGPATRSALLGRKVSSGSR
jgi:hypothetical protein